MGTRSGPAAGRLRGWTPHPPAAWLLIPVLLAVPIFAHGCHTGDHDDEPLFAPPPARVTEPETPR